MSKQSEAFSALDSIESGRWDQHLHRLHGAIHYRQKTDQYQATIIAGSKCPTCDSPNPRLHPAMQFEGEVQPCSNPWHNRTTEG